MSPIPNPRNNRSDLAVTAVPDQPYGEAGAQVAAQQAVPMGRPPGPEPGRRGPLTRPSERPGEPVTAGAPFGAGAGPETLGSFPMQPTPEQAVQWRLQELLKLQATNAISANLVALVHAVSQRSGGASPPV